MLTLRSERADGPAARALWAEYMADVAARLPGFEPTEEIFATPDAFTGPGTAWLVGYVGARAVCCGGMRPIAPGVAELKRMFVTEDARGRGHGRALLRALERLAVEAGCARVRVFTTEVLVEARAMYDAAGYRLVGTLRDGDRTDLWLERALAVGAPAGTTPAMQRDPQHEPTGREADEDPSEVLAAGGAGAPAPSESVDADPRPAEEAGEDREREARGGDA